MTPFQALRLRQKLLLQSVAKEREMKEKKIKYSALRLLKVVLPEACSLSVGLAGIRRAGGSGGRAKRIDGGPSSDLLFLLLLQSTSVKLSSEEEKLQGLCKHPLRVFLGRWPHNCTPADLLGTYNLNYKNENFQKQFQFFFSFFFCGICKPILEMFTFIV
jgi:hypothetical protein